MKPAASRPRYRSRGGFRASRSGTPREPNLRVGRESTRRRSGTGFAYYDEKGRLIRDRQILKRIRSLAVPPAYRNVWICPDSNGHIQATGRDDKGRKQYRYHPRWSEVRDSTKYEHMLEFAKVLPAVRARVSSDMAKRGLPRERCSRR